MGMSPATDPDDAVDLYEYVTLVGTIRLLDGTLQLSGPNVARLKAFVERCRRMYKCQSDPEVWASLPDMYHGTIHLRSVGNTAGTDEEGK
jgi:hypothetical protein